MQIITLQMSTRYDQIDTCDIFSAYRSEFIVTTTHPCRATGCTSMSTNIKTYPASEELQQQAVGCLLVDQG